MAHCSQISIGAGGSVPPSCAPSVVRVYGLDHPDGTKQLQVFNQPSPGTGETLLVTMEFKVSGGQLVTYSYRSTGYSGSGALGRG